MMKKPPKDVIEKSLDIRCRSKCGNITRQEHDWNMKVFEKYEEWYNKTEAIVFNRTIPFGSSVYKPEEPDLL